MVRDAALEGVITVEVQKVLVYDNPRVPVLYLVPNVHKSLNHPPGHPIILDIGSIFQPFAIYVDSYLKDIAKKLPHCHRDINDLLNRLEGMDTSDVTWLSDVKSLYTHIPQQEGMEAVSTKLKECVTLSNRDIHFLMSLFDIILTKNYFKFGTEYYLQLQGRSMGSPVAPRYENIFMDSIESNKIIPSKYGVHIKAWYRFVDDIFVVWTVSENALEEFTNFINSMHNLLEFLVTKDAKEICFLDVKIIPEDDGLHTTLYSKPTDKNNLLQKNCFPNYRRDSLRATNKG